MTHLTSSLKAAAIFMATAILCASWQAAAWGEPITVIRTTADPGGADAQISGHWMTSGEPLDRSNDNFGSENNVIVRVREDASAHRYDKGYMRFRLPSDIDELETATLELFMQATGSQSKTYRIYGLLSPTADDWNGYGYNGTADMARLGADWAENAITWSNAPGNVDAIDSTDVNSGNTIQLMQIVVPGISESSRVINQTTPHTNALVNFLNSHINAGSEYVTFIMTPVNLTGTAGGFLSKEHENVLNPGSPAHAPRLSLTYTPIPEPATCTLLGGCLAALAAFRRRRTT